MECQDPKRAVDLDNDHDKHNDKVLRFVSRTRAAKNVFGSLLISLMFIHGSE